MTGNIPEIQSRCVENDTCLADNANASAGSPKTSPEVFPSAIEFYVWSDEGINLFVDLDSSPLDWTERLKNEVYICESIYRDKCLQQNLCWFKGHKEFAECFQWNNHPGLLKDDYLQKEAPSSSNLMTDNCMVIDQLDEANGSVIFSAITSRAINADASERIDEDQTIISSETDFDVQNQKLAGSEICTEEDNREMNLDNDMNNALRKTDISDPVSGGPSSLSTSDHQNLILETDICETSTLQNSCRILNLSVDNPGSLAAGPMDMESSDIEQCPTDVSDYSLQTSAEKLERNNLSATMEISEHSQFPESLEKPLPVSHILEPNGAHKRKKLTKNETRRCYSEPDRRVLRSVTKKRGLPRRSRRLILKTVSS
ncbi:uncharacterized protein LOC111457658 isoform X1 [Cucurbita moschata]|uniref:Uncharacterized protein LOC111457658 isoform X1 n=2 Tax=Cucurbita TaxID=3660 RepID=A0A6J1GUR5_CUCMO|nr:uncharacterized protein LOC111457658 isoform X1 [Cucurbita moschata]XP_022955761.1 uncharacterized protein LOC111457658 isoform X1 [Cucurbita moschata]XP_022955763.1 uncharacterized protein LOC111457658 isoform X1 [Cucurbita moschata]XP_022955764.1 uncharacterized protein LOC111457658 isoform X1 [Cucurbita moschata]XP_022955765.1 uncharacterized protein LOC111457658 isoform X1 [Cucurbita moschata]